MSNKNSRPPYNGSELGLVISIDFGTTFSGTSWALLEPDLTPQIRDVTGLEGLEHLPTSTKIPTVLLYDHQGKLRAAGGQTVNPDMIADAQEMDWVRVEWFKLLLRPEHLREQLDAAPKTILPRNKELVDVIGDLYRYIVRQSHKNFHEKMIGSTATWEKVKDRIQYVLSHPNGWNTYQHSILAQAAIKGGLVPDSEEGRGRIHFVSEGEAAFHWCMNEGICKTNLEVGSNVMVVDAGGGTIDTSSFRVRSLHPLQLEESSAPECHLAGSVFVTQAFRKFAENKLVGSSYGESETIAKIVEKFDERIKCSFSSSDTTQGVPFGGRRDNAPEFGILSGRMIVQGQEMADFFEPSCTAAAAAVKAHTIPGEKMTVVVVGGFAGSPYLFSELQHRLSGLDIEVLRARDSTAKAAANGAISFYLDHYVSARVARWTYGVRSNTRFIRSKPEHRRRRSKLYTNSANGVQYLPGFFQVYLKKGTVVEETSLTRFSFSQSFSERKSVTFSDQLSCYRGDKIDIKFCDEDETHLFQELCSVSATIPETCLVQEVKAGSSEPFWRCYYKIVVSFGTTEFKCTVEWKDENGVLQSGPVTTVWNEG